MKPLLLAYCFFLAMALTASEPCQVADRGKAVLPIILSQNAPVPTREAAADLAQILGKITGGHFVIETTGEEAPARGIILGTEEEFPSAEDHRALEAFPEPRSRERFLLRSTSGRIRILASDQLGVGPAVYTFLDHLGCRWVFPSDKWELLPQEPDLTVDLDRVEAPVFRLRQFFGTGGFGPSNPIDPKLTLKDRWETWKKRNRFGGEYLFSGHTGEAFSLAARAELEAHPEYRAMVDGQRRPWSVGVKPCASNPAAVKLYLEDRLKAFRQALTTDPDGPRSFAVSVEPGDGGGHCECPDCLRIGNGSVSDRVFHLANQVARAVADEFPGRYVSLYAYNEHAAVPSLPLEPNVYVVLIPYGFQRTGLSGDDLIAAWSAKVKRKSLYDYWSIPDWENCLPSFDFVHRPAERIRQWHDAGIEGVSNESVWSAGAMGLGWYVSSRLLWNPATREREVLDEVYRRAFGPAEPPLRRMLERWSSGFLLHSHELALSFRDLAEARKLAAGSPEILARTDDLLSYVHYLSLWFDYQEAKPGTPERAAAARSVVTHLWRSYADGMTSPYRMWQLVANRYEKDPSLVTDFDPKTPDASGWRDLTPITGTDLEAYLAGGLRRHQPGDFPMPRYGTSLLPVAALTGPSGEFSKPLRIGSTAEFEFEASPEMTTLPLRIRVTAKPNAQPDKLTLTRPDGTKVHEQSLPADGAIRDLEIPLKGRGRYRLEIFDQKTTFDLSVPKGVPLILRSFTSPDLSTRLWFQVPKGLKRLAIACPGVIPIKLFDADGNAVAHGGEKFLIVDVPPGQDGRPWSFSGYKSYTPIRFINVPQVMSFFPDTLMVPETLRSEP